MDTRQERLSRLDSALLDKRQICSSEGVLCAFPSALKSPFMIDGVGLIICRQGNFNFILNQKTFSAKAGDTLFLPKDSLFQVLQASDNVEVHYTGKLIDGTVFDSSVERGVPASFGVTQVIPGWVEALQLMHEGDKWRLYIPSDLAYGPNGAGGVIGPNMTLIFDVELLRVIKK